LFHPKTGEGNVSKDKMAREPYRLIQPMEVRRQRPKRTDRHGEGKRDFKAGQNRKTNFAGPFGGEGPEVSEKGSGNRPRRTGGGHFLKKRGGKRQKMCRKTRKDGRRERGRHQGHG